jgi:predicted nucleic acid-binding protein
VIVVDTSVLIDHLRGRPEARDVLREAVTDGQVLGASVLTRIEVTAGVRSDERRATDALFRALRWLPVTDAVAEDAGLLARRYRRSHGSIDVVDYVVAASARVHDADVWTLNLKHFPMFDDLRPPY